MPDRMKSLLHIAVDWQVRLESGSATDQERHAFDRWLHANPAHEAAWQRVNHLLHDSFSIVRESGLHAPGQIQAARRAILNTRRRKMFSGALMLAGASAGTALLVNRQMPLSQWMADLRTGTAERRDFTLADGSNLQLNARSAADIDFTARHRDIHLREGALIIRIAQDTNRPLSVKTKDGSIQSSDGQFMLSYNAGQSHLVVMESSADILTHDGNRTRLAPGEGALFNQRGIQQMDENALAYAAWGNGMLSIESGTMQDVIASLKPYYPGMIRMSPEVAALKVFGSFPLADAPDVLRTLAHTLPIEMRQYGNWLIDLRHA